MSAQAGYYYFDGRPIPDDLEADVSSRLTPIAPDHAGTHREPGLLMVSRGLHVSLEDAREQQPYRSAGVVMTWDGRLDNRDDLLLLLRRTIGPDHSDVAIATAAYHEWRETCFARLIGDWSLVLWDSSTQSLILASDYMGIRPLYYALDPTYMAWSTRLEALALTTRRSDVLEERYVVGALCYATPPGLTPFKNINTVPAAHAVTIDHTGVVSTRQWWSYPSTEIRLTSTDDYEQGLRAAFRCAVRDRLRAQGTVWATLSGGLDSSSVVCMADHVVRLGECQASKLDTISWVSEDSPQLDERRFITTVEEHRGRRGHHVATTAVLRSATSEISWVTPRAPTETLRALCDLLVRSGSRVLLTGHGGDATMGNDVECTSLIADCIVEHHPLVAIGLAHDLARATRMTLWNVLAQTVAQLRPVESRVALAMSRILRTLALTPGRSHEFEDVFLLRRSYRALWEAEIRRQVYQVAPYPLPSVRHILASLFYFADTRGLQAPSEFIPVLTTHPYLDRRLVEYILAIPYSVLCSPGKPRAAMRLAFAPFVPARILGRVSKGYAAPFIVHNIRALTSDWLHNLDSLEIVRRGLVEEERLATRLRALDSGAVTGLGTLSTMLSTELWLQQITRRLASAA